jgi:4-diphosphocytidyl-2C-methyl-D-erythritol kinase
MTQAHIDSTHRNLGELAAMAHQTQEAERKILARAEEQLDKVQADLKAASKAAMTGGGDKYMELVTERGRLQQVIASARKHLGA